MSFQKLRQLAYITTPEAAYCDLVDEWDSKRKSLQVNISDLPRLVAEFKARKQEPYPENSEITLVDTVPSTRLANACESVSNLVYSMAEIAARVANRTNHAFPTSFNALRKKLKANKLDEDLAEALGDLQWYERIREIRTEWAHFSSPFVGIDKEEPSIVLRSFRSKDDRQHFDGHVSFSIDDLAGWAQAALSTIDRFADYLLVKHVLPTFNLDQVITNLVRDKNGFPIIKNARMQTEQITIKEYLLRSGVIDHFASLETWSTKFCVPLEVLKGAMKDTPAVAGHTTDGKPLPEGLYAERVVRDACKHLVKFVVTTAS